MKTVGKFSINNGTLSGPALYMTDQGNARLDRILSGTDFLFNSTVHLSPDVETAILVWMQTDYAAWLGAREMMAMCQKKVA